MKTNRRNFLKQSAASAVAVSVVSAQSVKTTGALEPSTALTILPSLDKVIDSVDDFYTAFSDLVYITAAEVFGECYDKLILSAKMYNAIVTSAWFDKRVRSESRYNFGTENLGIDFDPSTRKTLLANILNIEIFVQNVQNTDVFLPDNVLLITNSVPSNRPAQTARLTVRNL